jgi:hypothetical protein
MEHATSEEAEKAFYAAFHAGDLPAMRRVWASHDSIYCIHPRGELLLGQDAVMGSWRQILAEGGVGITAEPVSASVGANLAVHLVTERLVDATGRLSAVVMATNVYELGPAGWRMLMHHGSPAPLGSVSSSKQPLH